MRRATKQVMLVYGTWVLFWFGYALFGKTFHTHGEYGVVAHLTLSLTGLPLSLLSWNMPNGSISGVVAAGMIGMVQWAAFIEINGRICAR